MRRPRICRKSESANAIDIVVDFKHVRTRRAKSMSTICLSTKTVADRQREVPLADIVAKRSGQDPAVGKFLEFRVVKYTGAGSEHESGRLRRGQEEDDPAADVHRAGAGDGAKKRTFEFGRSNGTDEKPWTIKTDGGQGLGMDPHRVSAAPTWARVEIWHLESGDELDAPRPHPLRGRHHPEARRLAAAAVGEVGAQGHL